MVKFFWQQLGKPTDPEEWKHRNGVISVIRRRMGAGAPAVATVERTLKRLAEDEDDELSRNTGGGRQRTFSHEDDLYVGLLICEGHSQRSATFLINGELAAVHGESGHGSRCSDTARGAARDCKAACIRLEDCKCCLQARVTLGLGLWWLS